MSDHPLLKPRVISEDLGDGVMRASYKGAYSLTDGPVSVSVFWEAEDEGEHAPGYWVAKLCDKQGERGKYIMGTGESQHEALADLCIALYTTWLAEVHFTRPEVPHE